METAEIKRTAKLELLDKKLSLLLRMRELTESAELTGSGAEERYIALISKREEIVKQLKGIDICLSGYAPEEGEDKLLTMVKNVTEQILEMDNQLSLRVPDLINGIKNNLKQIKRGKNINRAYNADIIGIEGNVYYSMRK